MIPPEIRERILSYLTMAQLLEARNGDPEIVRVVWHRHIAQMAACYGYRGPFIEGLLTEEDVRNFFRGLPRAESPDPRILHILQALFPDGGDVPYRIETDDLFYIDHMLEQYYGNALPLTTTLAPFFSTFDDEDPFTTEGRWGLEIGMFRSTPYVLLAALEERIWDVHTSKGARKFFKEVYAPFLEAAWVVIAENRVHSERYWRVLHLASQMIGVAFVRAWI